MISGITIHNFRGLREVTLDGLARVNVIVGDNGSGKTALLEAVFMAMSNSASRGFMLRGFRGMPSNLAISQPSAIESMAAAFIGEADSETRVETRGNSKFARSFSAAPDPTRSVQPIYQPSALPTAGFLGSNPGGGFPASNAVEVPVVFRWSDGEGASGESVIRSGTGWINEDSATIPFIETYFLAAVYGGQQLAPTYFSDLDKAGESGPFIEALREQFQNLDVVSLQLDGGQTVLHARLHGHRQQRPLELLSGGLARLSVMLLAISRPSTQIVLIDEIENGLHHERFRLLWQQIRTFADRANTQVFATTHSQECLDAAADAMTEHPDDFALLRTARADGACVVGILPGINARHLLRSGLEVRG